MSKNTLFHYFGTPKSVKKSQESSSSSSSKQYEEDNPETPDSDSPKGVKRKRIKVLDSSDDENSSDNTPKKLRDDSVKKSFSSKLEGFHSPSTKERAEKRSVKQEVESSGNGSSSFVMPHVAANNSKEDTWLHTTLPFLKPEKIKDINKNRPSDKNYDPRTLYVPEDFKAKQTPAMRQWWEMKSRHFDCVLFFKVGKFYELYHMDAVVGVQELGFSYMKGEFAHSGFPESAYGRMSASLVEKGYKVARVEQTETPEMMAERCRRKGSCTKFDKVVNREICQLTNKGTCVFGIQDTDAKQPDSSYLFAITEKITGAGSTYGVCFIDTSIGEFHIGQFEDDQHRSRLLTLFAHFPPALVLHPKNMISAETKKVFKTSLGKATVEALLSEKQFYTAHRTVEILQTKKYFRNADDELNWPQTLKDMLEGEGLIFNILPEYELALNALGGCLWYLTDSFLDIQLLSMSQFTKYVPDDNNGRQKNSPVKRLILDAITLKNLNIIEKEGSLLSKLDYCNTAFGKRMLRQWVCVPICDVNVIKERQDAISELLDKPSFLQEVRLMLSRLPDLERLISKIHALGNKQLSTSHPDSRAIFYEEKTYSKRKIHDFISVLNGFELATKIVAAFSDISSSFLKEYTHLDPEGSFPELSERLQFFKTAFDRQQAESDGVILPGKNVDKDYDETLAEIREIEDELEEYKISQEKFFKCKINYFGSDKKRFQLEIPADAARKANSDYHLEGTKKGSKVMKRFSTSETKDFLARMMAAEERKRNVLKDLARRIFEKFSKNFEKWNKAIYCLSVIDVICSLAEYSRVESFTVCVPEVVETSDSQSFIEIREGVHPCIANTDFIPNDTDLGINGKPTLLLLTGPNMGGKSTLMRQVALLTIMAQIGCHVPASECKLSIIDRIFTRLGASDDIMAGQSTFLVELNETRSILQHATPHSLVLLDELGRGTSTYDGTAIAAAVMNELTKTNCRTIFSTHYHQLVDDFKNKTNVALGHMACMIENENIEDASEETVTFLYKLADGACPKSYGFNAAKLAGVPKHIITRAIQISNVLENEQKLIKMYRKFMTLQNPIECRKFIMDLRADSTV